MARKSRLEPGEREALLLLLQHKADVNVKETYSGKTPLALAVENGNIEAAELLRQQGAR